MSCKLGKFIIILLMSYASEEHMTRARKWCLTPATALGDLNGFLNKFQINIIIWLKWIVTELQRW